MPYQAEIFDLIEWRIDLLKILLMCLLRVEGCLTKCSICSEQAADKWFSFSYNWKIRVQEPTVNTGVALYLWILITQSPMSPAISTPLNSVSLNKFSFQTIIGSLR